MNVLHEPADTGQVDDSGVTGGTGGGEEVTGTVTEVAAYRATDVASAMAPVVALEIVALLAIPPAVYFLWIRRRKVDA